MNFNCWIKTPITWPLSIMNKASHCSTWLIFMHWALCSAEIWFPLASIPQRLVGLCGSSSLSFLHLSLHLLTLILNLQCNPKQSYIFLNLFGWFRRMVFSPEFRFQAMMSNYWDFTFLLCFQPSHLWNINATHLHVYVEVWVEACKAKALVHHPVENYHT